jgi:hypothetical protein
MQIKWLKLFYWIVQLVDNISWAADNYAAVLNAIYSNITQQMGLLIVSDSVLNFYGR